MLDQPPCLLTLCFCACKARRLGACHKAVLRACPDLTDLLQEGWAQGEDGDGSSSDGRGSSYFSGERLDQIHSSTASPMHSQQSLTGHIDRSSLVGIPVMHCICALHSYVFYPILYRSGGPAQKQRLLQTTHYNATVQRAHRMESTSSSALSRLTGQ